jgi:hypothetical protein
VRALRATALCARQYGALVTVSTTITGRLDDVERLDDGTMIVNLWDGILHIAVALPPGRHVDIDDATADLLSRSLPGRVQLAQAREDLDSGHRHQWTPTGRHRAEADQ